MHTLPPIIEPIAIMDVFIDSVHIEPIGQNMYRTTCFSLQRDLTTGVEYRVVVAKLVASKDCHQQSRQIGLERNLSTAAH